MRAEQVRPVENKLELWAYGMDGKCWRMDCLCYRQTSMLMCGYKSMTARAHSLSVVVLPHEDIPYLLSTHLSILSVG